MDSLQAPALLEGPDKLLHLLLKVHGGDVQMLELMILANKVDKTVAE